MKKIYTAVFRHWHEPYAWFGRDSGLVTEGLRRIGVDSRLVILQTPTMPHDERFLAASREQFLDSGFWKSLALDGVVLQGGADVGIDPVSAAIRESGTKLLLRLDTDGVVAPQVDPYLYCYNLWWWLAFHNRHPAWMLALGKVGLKTLFPNKFGPGRVIRRLLLGDFLLAESRIAAARLMRLLRTHGAAGAAERVVHLPIPVAPEWKYPESTPKENIIISVARWNDAQKDAPKLIKTVAAVLGHNPEYRAVVIGNGEDLLRKLVDKHAGKYSGQIQLTGRLPHSEIPAHEQKAQIFICSSRAESMNISSAEALCCGCSVVGPAEIASMHEYTSASSGTLTWTRRTSDFCDAVNSEISAWRSGQRSAECISNHFRSLLAPEAVAELILDLCKA
jgi:glycosyltransferase involved in cell wall biosynthesis